MTAQVDQGDILVQRRFPLSEGETALTLNTKCYEAAIDGFEELVKGLADSSLVPQPQTAPIQKYFGRKDRPAAAGALRWSDSAAALATSVRALDFGTYANPVSSAKVALGGRLLRVAQAEAAESAHGAAPGTVTQADSHGITVATADAALRLTRIETLDGKPVPVAEAGAALGQSALARCSMPSTTCSPSAWAPSTRRLCAHEGVLAASARDPGLGRTPLHRSQRRARGRRLRASRRGHRRSGHARRGVPQRQPGGGLRRSARSPFGQGRVRPRIR